MSSRFIFDPLTGVPTISATQRSKRVDQTGAVSSISSKVGEQKGKEAPQEKKEFVDIFAKGNEHLTPPTLYQDEEDWNVRVFSNKYPLLEDHEVIVHSPDINMDIQDLSVEHNVKIIRAYLNRTHHYNSQDKEVLIFNNKGGRAGASILHPHSQLVAAKGFPGIVQREKEKALEYYNEHNTSYWSDEIAEELRYGKRVVLETQHYVVYVPKACRWSYELSLVPKNPRPNFAYIEEPEIYDLAEVLKKTLIAYDKLFDKPDRNFWLHTMRYEPYHWHMGFIAHYKVFGALEYGSGIWVNDKATPEEAAEDLRKVLI